jgi:hypothetical protein
MSAKRRPNWLTVGAIPATSSFSQMSKVPGLTEISRRRSIGSLQQALDQAYRQLLQAAKADWLRLFASHDPSDEMVSVRISTKEIAEELAGIPRAGFVPARKKPASGKIRRRSA